jgi:hypothetical protein
MHTGKPGLLRPWAGCRRPVARPVHKLAHLSKPPVGPVEPALPGPPRTTGRTRERQLELRCGRGMQTGVLSTRRFFCAGCSVRRFSFHAPILARDLGQRLSKLKNSFSGFLRASQHFQSAVSRVSQPGFQALKESQRDSITQPSVDGASRPGDQRLRWDLARNPINPARVESETNSSSAHPHPINTLFQQGESEFRAAGHNRF